MSDEEHSEPEALLAPLDGEPGPMPALLPAQAEALTASVVARWSAGLSGMEPADDTAGPAVPMDTAQAQGLVHSVTKRHALLRPLRVAAVAGAVLSVGGLAYAALHVWHIGFHARPHAPVVGENAHEASSARSLGAPEFAPSQPSVVESEPERTRTPDPKRHDGLTASQRLQRAANGRPSAERTRSAEATLERANAMRAMRDWPRAQRLYVQIADADGRLRERYVAAVAAASLCVLHTGQPRRALELYRRALRWFPDGDLSEEARLGIVRAFAALEDPRSEAVALRAFLEHHPDSADAARARTWLLRLGAD